MYLVLLGMLDKMVLAEGKGWTGRMMKRFNCERSVTNRKLFLAVHSSRLFLGTRKAGAVHSVVPSTLAMMPSSIKP